MQLVHLYQRQIIDFSPIDLFFCFLCILYLSGSPLSWWYEIGRWIFYGKPQRQEAHEHLSWSFLGQKVLYAMEMLCLLKIYNLCNENKGLIYGELMWRDTPFPKTWSRKYFLRPVTKVYVRETTIILCIFEFTKFSHFIA